MTSGDEEEFAGGLAGFEVAVGVGGVGEGVDVFEAEFEGAVGYGVEDVFGAGFEVGAGGDVVLEGGTGDVERAHGGEADEVEGWDGVRWIRRRGRPCREGGGTAASLRRWFCRLSRRRREGRGRR